MSNFRNTTAVTVGIDEAGRGPLAGPVVAAACVLPQNNTRIPSFIRDSKQLTPEAREEAFTWITAHCAYGTGRTEAAVIDAEGILAATEMAMQSAVRELCTRITPTYLLIDGRDKFWFDFPHSSLIRGDQLEPCISAASIIAKVTRDRIMREEAERFPQYGFEEHKGYGAPMHLAAILKYGPCPIHRTTFLRNLLNTGADAGATPTGQRRARSRAA